MAAGVVAGVVAAALSVAVSALMGGSPPARIAAGSSLTAALIGALLFWALSRASARPAGWLWGIALFFATAISLVVAFLPHAFLPLPRSLSFLNGLAGPLAQVLHATGLLHPAVRHAAARPPHGHRARVHHGGPGGFLAAAITMHYVTAIVTAAVVPSVARRLGRARPVQG